MPPLNRSPASTLAWTGAAVAAVLVCAGAAGAEVPAGAHFVAPTPTPVASPAVTPLAVPAVVAPQHAAPVQADASSVSAPAATAACTAPPALTRFDYSLRRTARRIVNDDPLTIVAIGSSSTAGAGASSPAANYPSRLEAALKERFPGHDITVFNRGVNGEVTSNMLARFETDVIAAHPQLVLWQVGTNSVLRDQPLRPHAVQLHEGIDELKAIGADVVLIDPQYSPKVIAKAETPGMVEQIAVAAKNETVDLFRRFAVMRDWSEAEHLPFDTFVSPDELHMNDWGYGCMAKLLAAAIAEAATRPVASAARSH
jgi:acyl-CoA thioesterase I